MSGELQNNSVNGAMLLQSTVWLEEWCFEQIPRVISVYNKILEKFTKTLFFNNLENIRLQKKKKKKKKKKSPPS